MIKINGKEYNGSSLLIDKHGNIIIDGVLQGSTKESTLKTNDLSLVEWIKELFKK